MVAGLLEAWRKVPGSAVMLPPSPLVSWKTEMVERSGTPRNQTTQDGTSDGTVHEAGVIRVALIEDNRLVREALTSVLNRAPDIQAVGEAPTGHELLLEGNPHVVLLDLGLENGDSLRVARSILQGFPGARVIVMDLLPAHEELQEFVSAGVSGFIMKDAHLDVVLNTIRSVASGLKVLPDQMTATLFSEIAREVIAKGGSNAQASVRMTEREREVINLISEGLSNKAIGKHLHISVHTVKSHLRNIMEKLTLNSRLQIAAYAHRQDIDESESRHREEVRRDEGRPAT
jgi:DNA-binding NarL/FixJ family response regulator